MLYQFMLCVFIGGTNMHWFEIAGSLVITHITGAALVDFVGEPQVAIGDVLQQKDYPNAFAGRAERDQINAGVKSRSEVVYTDLFPRKYCGSERYCPVFFSFCDEFGYVRGRPLLRGKGLDAERSIESWGFAIVLHDQLWHVVRNELGAILGSQCQPPALYFKVKPRALFFKHDDVSLSSLFGSEYGRLIRFVGLNQGLPKQGNGSDSEDCHDPLCKRVLRRNQTPGPPPPLWFIVVFVGAGVAIALTVTCALHKAAEVFSANSDDKDD